MFEPLFEPHKLERFPAETVHITGLEEPITVTPETKTQSTSFFREILKSQNSKNQLIIRGSD